MKINALIASFITRRLTITLTFIIASMLCTNIFAQPATDKDDGINGTVHQKFAGKVVFLKENLAKEEVTEAKLTDEFTLGDLIYFRVYMKKSMMNSLLEKDSSLNQTDAVAHANFILVFSLDDGKPVETVLDFGTNAIEKRQWTTWRGSLKHSRPTGILGMDNFRQFLAESNLAQGKHNVKLSIFPAYKGVRGEAITGEFILNVNAINPNDSATCLPRTGSTDAEIERFFIQTYKAKGLAGVPKKAVITAEGWTVEKNKISGRIESRKTAGVVAVNVNGECSYQYFWLKQDYNGSSYGTPYFSFTGDKTKINCGCLK
jgi:hypothetical protein